MSTTRGSLGQGILAGLLALYFGASLLAAGSVPPSTLQAAWAAGGDHTTHVVGPVGEVLGAIATWALGPGLRWLLALMPILVWVGLARRDDLTRRRVAGTIAGLLGLAGLLAHPSLSQTGVPTWMGGALGSAVEAGIAALLGSLGSFLLLAGVTGYLIVRSLPPLDIPLPGIDALAERLEGVRDGAAAAWHGLRGRVASLAQALPSRRAATQETEPTANVAVPPAQIITWDAGEETVPFEEEIDPPAPLEPVEPAELAANDPAGKPVVAALPAAPAPLSPRDEGDQEFRLSRDPAELTVEDPKVGKRVRRRGKLPLPGLDLLDDVKKEERGFSRDVLQMNARLLLDTLANYGIDGQINEIRPGPVVTTFEFEPAPGVRVSQITSREDDLALAMRAIRIRIVAPIPGKAAVGIEIPNPYPQMVTLKEVLAPTIVDPDVPPLTTTLGRDTEGIPVSGDLAEMPHLLVAGATGSGKSVCLNALICNLLMRNGPDSVRMLMIDPKMLELSVYNGIPHLLHPVITQPKEALKALRWMVGQMTGRYNALSSHSVRNIGEYNDKVRRGQIKDGDGRKVTETMPFIVVIVDELADLMMILGSELETPIARLAQMARAVGIHLVLATQRPSVNVITGVIKANFPSRIGFRVISKIDSRTILDCPGAEQLLGKGDMLFLLAGQPQPGRVHGAYLSLEECERITDHWRKYTEEEARIDLDARSSTGNVDLGEDELIDEARRIVVETQVGSVSMLQRRLRIGYTRAGRLMDMLEEEGVVGPPSDGGKAREVLMAKGQLEAQE